MSTKIIEKKIAKLKAARKTLEFSINPGTSEPWSDDWVARAAQRYLSAWCDLEEHEARSATLPAPGSVAEAPEAVCDCHPPRHRTDVERLVDEVLGCSPCERGKHIYCHPSSVQCPCEPEMM